MLSLNVYETNIESMLKREPLQPGYSVALLDSKAIDLVAAQRGQGKGDQLREYYAHGAIGIAIYKNQTIVSYGFIGYNRSEFPEKIYTVFTIPANSAHIFGCYTFPPFRSKGFYRQVLGNLVDKAYHDANDQVFIDTVIGNRPAEKSVDKMGFKSISKQYKFFLFGKIIFEFERFQK